MKSACYRLCVYASGSWITDIFICFTLIKVSRLHLGQNNGKFLSLVSLRIIVRVLLPQTGHNIHSVLFKFFLRYTYTFSSFAAVANCVSFFLWGRAGSVLYKCRFSLTTRMIDNNKANASLTGWAIKIQLIPHNNGKI